MCRVTSTELKNNLSYYLELSNKVDICITKNGKSIAIITNTRDKSFAKFMELEGCLSDNDSEEDYDEIIGREIKKKCGF